MSTHKRNFLAAKIFIAVIGGVGTLISSQIEANFPVVDGSNLTQNIITAGQQVAAVQKQVQQYQIQLQQYENMLQNSIAPSAYIWDSANQTINNLLEAQDTLSYYTNQTGSIDNYLSRYKDVSYYRTSPCFTMNSCSDEQRQAILDGRANSSEAQKRANAAVLKGINQQQQSLQSDANRLRQLQSQASSANGQMRAIQAANQLASAQTNQLLQIRGLLIAQQNAAITRAQVVADREAQMTAGDEQFRSGTYTKSPKKSW